ncbi:alpha/beta hydrolase [Variovorax guangxiensis]|uniref:alpha/beta hydrolase n=1 Tax=Variovorax guangxiensis TaxID=1775474 RepID=UPI00286C8523|nr:alpha/beta hydrolase [Variovorax guangxiensis]
MRADWDALFAAPVDAHVEDVVANGVPCQWIAASGARADRVIVYLHGGGYQVGSLVSHSELMARLSAAAAVRVLGVGYRLAPEHPYPAPLDDSLVVLAWLRGQGYLAQEVALAGDSAGGGLALSVLLALQLAGQAPPAAAFTMSAWTDLTAGGESYEARAALDPINQRPMLVAMARNYLGNIAATEPLASPLHASAAQMQKLPPLLLQVGERETVVSDSELFARKAAAAGASAQLEIWPEMFHVFQQFPELPEAREAVAAGGRFLAAHLSAASSRKNSS